MNKAFVRDPEPTVERCPQCGATGQPVGAAILDVFVRLEARDQLGEEACFCPTATCPVAYFDAFDRQVEVSQLAKPVYPKDPDAPICACFGFTCAEIDEDLAEGVATRTRAQLERARSPSARCSQIAANGASCVASVQSYFMQHRGGR
jgi:Zinc binding domain